MSKAEFQAVKGKQVLLDTNIIMKIEDSPKEVRECLLAFATSNEVCICDTVLYELLRNMNAKRFRERHALIRKAGLHCISENESAVKAMFERVNWLYLSLLHNQPQNFLHRQQNDLWIIAAGLVNGIRHFLTTDQSSDFLPALFTTTTFSVDAKQKLCLHEFKNKAAVNLWNKLMDAESCAVVLHKGYLEAIKKQSHSLRRKE